MKKLLVAASLAVLIGFSVLPLAVSAATCTGPSDGASCGAGNVCQQDSNGFYACFPAPKASSACTGTSDTSCGAGNSCQQDANGFYGCFPNANAQAASIPGASTANSGTFVPLAGIPGLTTGVSPNNLADFFNNLYKFCIGAAAVLAVLEITMGGFQVMSGDSVTAHSAGRDRIMGAILGLVLVLSPFLVFSIINPCILTFSTSGGSCTGGLSDDLKKLQPSTASNPQTQAPGPTGFGSSGATGVTQGAGGTGASSGTGNGGAGGATAPSNLQVTAQTATTATLSWSPPASGPAPASYNVYNGSTLVAQGVTGTTAKLTGLQTGTAYNFSVSAVDAGGGISTGSTPIAVAVGVETVTSSAESGQKGYYILSYWTWSGSYFQGDTGGSRPILVQTGSKCWVYHSIYYPAASPIGLSQCQSDLQSEKNTQSQNSGQDSAYVQNMLGHQCTQSATQVVTEAQPPQPLCP